MSKFWSDVVHQLTPYTPGEQPKIQQLIKLNTNENPYGPSPKVIDALKAVADEKLRLYPDPQSEGLKAVIANYYGVGSANVFVGNGSDEVLAHVFQAFFKHEQPLLFPDITYSFYPVYCGLYGIEYEQIPLSQDFTLNIKDFRRKNGGIIFPNPNAPTGIPLPLAQIEQLLKDNNESVVVVDEAYVDFGTESAITLTKDYPNLLVTQTLSKSRSLAGLRLGFAIGHSDLIEGLIRVKDSFNSYPVDRFASAGAIASIEDHSYFEETTKKVITTREKVVEELNQLDFSTLPSGANFIFTQHSSLTGQLLAEKLRQKDIIIRHFKNPTSIENFIRVTIGSDAEMAVFTKVIQEIVTQAQGK